jgi:mRNA interferase HigB
MAWPLLPSRRFAPVVVIALGRLRDFWETYPDAESSLRVWYKVTRAAGWSNFADVRATFGNASAVGNCVVFNIAGNKYRQVTRVRYPIRTVFVLRIMTHAEYDDQERWQNDCGCHKPPPRRPRRPKNSPRKRRT